MAKLPTIAEIRKMSVEDLRSEVATVRREAARIRLGVELSKEKDASQVKKLRKHLAQILTVLQEKNATLSPHS
ncbi:50S ribosomal protein L29 [Candidatus Peribacteria bacterium RIFCSPLOWO2_12_FULL_53_10]|nr:MAG: 50S ribosomal protein L29 [Candidatus Peribacteria bacterium RIFCSPLOWO2_12_FULL_53_10]